MPVHTVTQQWLEGLPEEVRNHLHLQIGDRVEYVIGPGREVHLRAIDRPAIIGVLHRSDRPPLSLDQMREAMMESLVEDDERIKRGEG